jgi:WD40 repeat protein
VWELSQGNLSDDDGENPMCLEMITNIVPVEITPEGNRAAIANVDRAVAITAHGTHVTEEVTIWLWNLNEKEEEVDTNQYVTHVDCDGHSLPVTSIAFSSDGTRMASSSFDRSVRIWDLFSGKCEAVLEGHEHYALKAQFSTDGKALVSRSYHEFRLWNIG